MEEAALAIGIRYEADPPAPCQLRRPSRELVLIPEIWNALQCLNVLAF
jgi:hypothetical protein